MGNDEEDVEMLFKSWNPMTEDFNNTEMNQYYGGPGAGLNDVSQKSEAKPQHKAGETASDMRDTLPYLLIRGTGEDFNETTICSILKHIRIHHCFYAKKCKTYFVYLKNVHDLEDAFRTLEKVDYIPSVVVGNRKTKKFDQQDIIEQNDNNEDSAIETEYQEFENTINMEARTLKISDYNPNHPIFGFNHLIHPDVYERENSFLKTFDPLKRIKYVTDEHILERYNIFKELPEKFDKVCNYEFRSGRAIQKFSDDFNFESPLNKDQKLCFSDWNLKNCYICGRGCTSHCTECLTYYCTSRSCQDKLYDEHELMCSKKITLEYKPPKIFAPKKIFQNIAPVSGSKVLLVAFQQSNVVYLRSLENVVNIGYFNVLKKVFHLGKYCQKYQVTPACGDLVLVKIEKEYLRAVVLNTDQQDSIYVSYIDYGNVDRQPLDNFYVISEELAFLPCHVFGVVLKNVPYCFMSSQYRSFLYHLLNTNVLKIKYDKHSFDFGTGFYLVELFDDVLRMNVNKALIILQTPIELSDSNEVFFENSLKRFSLPSGPSGKSIQLAITDNSLINSGFISCTTKDLAYEIEKIQIDIQAYGKSQESSCYAPRVNELCIVKYEIDGKWCRGRCLELVGDGFPTIYFIDYGNISLVSVENIRKYPAKFTYPILTADVFIDDFDPENTDEETTNKLKEVFPNGGIVTCELYKNETDNSLYIKMPKA